MKQQLHPRASLVAEGEHLPTDQRVLPETGSGQLAKPLKSASQVSPAGPQVHSCCWAQAQHRFSSPTNCAAHSGVHPADNRTLSPEPTVTSAAHAPDIANAGLGTGNNFVVHACFSAFFSLRSDRHR